MKSLLKNKIIIGIIAVLLTGLVFYVFYNFTHPLPDASKKQAAKMIPQYPNASNWKMVYKRGLDILCIDNCNPGGVKIEFTSTDSLETISNYYNKTLSAQGWNILTQEDAVTHRYKYLNREIWLMPNYAKEAIIPNHYLFAL